MPQMRDVRLTDLLVDTSNARLPKEHDGQQETLLAAAMELKGKLLVLAEGIRDRGLDPLRPLAVRPSAAEDGKYVVVEGNRRLTAIKALEAPGIVEAALNADGKRKLNKLAAQEQRVPIDPVQCIVFDGPDEVEDLNYWVNLLHTGENEGRGLVAWRADERDRALARQGRGSLGGQVMEVVRAATGKEYRDPDRRKGILTTVHRLVSNPKVRKRLGIELASGRLVSWYPPEETIKGLLRIVDDLVARKEDSRSLGSAAAREQYAERIAPKFLPSPSTRLESSIPLSAPSAGSVTSTPRTPSSRRKPKAVRRTLIPRDCHIHVIGARLQKLYEELGSIELEKYENLVSVGLRVFTELSVDHVIQKNQLMTKAQIDSQNTPLAKRLKLVAKHLEDTANMPAQLREVVDDIADDKGVLAAAVVNWNQYVHNQYAHPKAVSLRTEWDELQPFFEYLWPPK